jgi:hypothetical protein
MYDRGARAVDIICLSYSRMNSLTSPSRSLLCTTRSTHEREGRRKNGEGGDLLSIKVTKRTSSMDQHGPHNSTLALFVFFVLSMNGECVDERREEDLEIIVESLSLAFVCEGSSSHLYDPEMHCTLSLI